MKVIIVLVKHVKYFKVSSSVPNNPMLIIPYVVLKELDRLKMQKTTSEIASQAIAFIYDQIRMRPHQICGQSAMDNEDKYIAIWDANDSIINCCLQFKQKFGNVVLLTNDMNLRNKSICSHIPAFSKSELEANFCFY